MRFGGPARRLALVAIVLLALVGVAAWLSWPDGRLPPAVAIGGVQVGGRASEEATRLVRAAAVRRMRRPVVLRWRGRLLVVTGEQLGATPALASALEEAKESQGRLSVLAARLGLGGTKRLDLVYGFERRALARLVTRLRQEIARPPRPATLEFRGRELVLARSQPGRAIDLDALTARLAELPAAVEVPTRVVVPRVRERQALAAWQLAKRLLAHPPAVIYKTTRADLGRAFLVQALRFHPRGGRLAVELDPHLLDKRLSPVFRDLEQQPRDAAFEIDGERVSIAPSATGLKLAIPRIAREIVARAGETQLRARFRTARPQFTTAGARRLRIEELVGEFTTPYSCCQPRVTNIERGASILDGTIVPPGGRLSLNETLGPRTRERGFVEAPMILRGRLVGAVGGGVSQLATTLYNAAFFAGLDLVEHVPHEFYISRYPMGREATVSWGWPDLVVRNDWRAAILVKTDAGETSVTIRLYSSQLGRRVETETGEPHDYVPARTRTTPDRSLPPGTRHVVQPGGVAGFTVSYTRRVYHGAKLRRDERWTVHYRPEDTIVEIGPPKPKPRDTEPEPPPPLRDRPR